MNLNNITLSPYTTYIFIPPWIQTTANTSWQHVCFHCLLAYLKWARLGECALCLQSCSRLFHDPDQIQDKMRMFMSPKLTPHTPTLPQISAAQISIQTRTYRHRAYSNIWILGLKAPHRAWMFYWVSESIQCLKSSHAALSHTYLFVKPVPLHSRLCDVTTPVILSACTVGTCASW